MKNKVIRDEKVAVVYAPGWGAGWSTWNGISGDEMEHFMLFDPTLVEMVLHNENERIPQYVESVYPDAYTGAADQLCVKWIPEGSLFRVTEYDGFESVEIRENIEWKAA